MRVSSAVSRIERFDGVPYGPETRERVTMDSEFPCLLNGGDTLTSFRVDVSVVEEPLLPCLESVLQRARITDRTEVYITEGTLCGRCHRELVGEFYGYRFVTTVITTRTLDGTTARIAVAFVAEHSRFRCEVTRWVCLAARQWTPTRLATTERKFFVALHCIVDLCVTGASLWTSATCTFVRRRETLTHVARVISLD